MIPLNYFKGIAIGQMGMRVVEFEETRLGDFFLKLRYFNKGKEEEARFLANLVRMQTMELINVQVDKKYRTDDPEEFWRFPWEDQKEEIELPDLGNDTTKQDLKRLNDIWRTG